MRSFDTATGRLLSESIFHLGDIIPRVRINVSFPSAVMACTPFLPIAFEPYVVVKARLELISARGGGNISLLPLALHLLSWLPLERLQSLREDRV